MLHFEMAFIVTRIDCTRLVNSICLLLVAIAAPTTQAFVAGRMVFLSSSSSSKRGGEFARKAVVIGAASSSPQPPVYGDVQAVIFDVDGTLADSGQLGFDATCVVLQSHHIPTITYAEYCEGTRYTTPDRLARHAGLLPEHDTYQAVGEKLGNEFDNLYIDLVSSQTAAFFPGMLDLVHNLPDNVKVGALTNAAGRYAHAVLKVNNVDDDRSSQRSRRGLYQRFESILGADEVVRPKPYGDGLWQVCRELNVPPASCVYIGDSPSDGLAAQAAGMPAIGVVWGAHTEQSLSLHFAHICRTVDELASLLPRKLPVR